MKPEPLVSVLMNCYNGEKYLRPALDSVLAQTYQNWEVVFWDNRSTDGSAEIVKSYDEPRFKYHLASEHTDLGTGRARAWSHITGEFVAVLDVDDLWFPTKLEKQIPLFDDPQVGIVISDTLFFNEQRERPLYDGTYPPTGWVFDQLLTRYFVSLETLVFRRATALRMERAFDADFSFIADFDIVARLSRISKLAVYPEVLAKWRVHTQSDTWRSPQAFIEEKERWLAKQIATDPSAVEEHAEAFRSFRRKNMRNKAIVALLRKQRLAALEALKDMDFGQWITWAVFALCFTPFSSLIVAHFLKRRTELRSWPKWTGGSRAPRAHPQDGVAFSPSSPTA